jgi:MFS family permease
MMFHGVIKDGMPFHLIGSIVGGLALGWFADRFGRRKRGLGAGIIQSSFVAGIAMPKPLMES